MAHHHKQNILLLTVICYLLSYSSYGQDTERPISPVLQLVSVNPLTGNASLEWQLSSSPDVAAYIVYINKNSSWIAIDTIWDPLATSYLNASSNADYFPESYVIAAYDSSANPSPLTEPHTTMFSSLVFDSCLIQVNLDWSPYMGWNGDLENYEVIISIDGGPDSLLQTVEAGKMEYIHQEIESYMNYCYYIRANHISGKVSTSNKICTYTQMPKIPEYINADYASVENGNEIHLSFTIDPQTEIYRFRLLTGSDPGNISEVISTFNNPPLWNIQYADNVEDPSQRHFYQLMAINACDSVVTESNVASNIILTVENREVVNELTWSPYFTWMDGVESYHVYRLIEGLLPELIVSLNGTDTAYSDDISAFQYSAPSGMFCYYVEASEGSQNPFGITGLSHSNISCGVVPVNVFVPNAFTPNADNKNDVFKPILSFTPRQYLLTIQNRWGNLIFESKDPLKGWEGTINGDNPAPEGVYIYYLRIISDEGEIIEKNGHVTLIYPK